MYVVINGGGKVGEHLATIMLRDGNEVALIEQDEEVAERLATNLNGRFMVFQGDGCDSRIQEDASIREADVFVAATGQDEANLVSCEIAMRIFDVPRAIARVNNPKNIRIFREVGIEAVSATALIATIIEEDAMLGGISVLSSLSHGNVALNEVTVPRMKHHDPETGVRAFDIEMPDGSLMVAVTRDEDGEMEVVSSETWVYPGDMIIIASDKDIEGEAVSAVRSL